MKSHGSANIETVSDAEVWLKTAPYGLQCLAEPLADKH